MSATLLAFGAVRLPIEISLNRQYRAAFFNSAKLNLGLRQQIGQLSFLAALGGFRAAVADLLWIQAHIDWTRTQWGRMLFLFNNVTTLQPRNLMFWEMSAWHMGYNASVAALQDTTQPRIALRLKHQYEYFVISRDLLQRGVANNPDKYKLYEDLGNLYRDKFKDHYAASQAYASAASFKEAPSYLIRFAAYELSFCPEHEREAYDQLLSLYKRGEYEWLPTLLSRLKYLQEKLNIPESQRVKIPENQLPPAHPNLPAN